MANTSILEPAHEPDKVRRIMGLLELLGGVGDVLDTPGRFTRTALAGRNPFASVFDPSKGVSGRDLLQQYGMVGENQDGLDGGDVGGFLAEMALDPTNLVGGGFLAKLLRSSSKAKSANRGIQGANDLAAAANRAMATAPRGVRVADQLPSIVRESPVGNVSNGVRGYLPDLTSEKIPGSSRRSISGDELREIQEAAVRRERGLESSRPSGFERRGYHQQKYPVEAQIQATFPGMFDDVSDIHMDAIKGLNPGHALQRAAENWPGASRVDLIRQLPPDTSLQLLDQGGAWSDVSQKIDSNRLSREVAPAPLSAQVEMPFMPSSVLERLAGAMQREGSRVTRLPPSNEFVKELQELQKIPKVGPMLAALLGEQVMARFGRSRQPRPEDVASSQRQQ